MDGIGIGSDGGGAPGELVEVALDGGRTLWVRVAPDSDQGPRDVGLRERFTDLPGMTDAIRWAAENLRAGLRSVEPDRVTAEFGLELALGRQGLVAALCGVGGKAGLKVTLAWGPDDYPPPPPPPADDPR